MINDPDTSGGLNRIKTSFCFDCFSNASIYGTRPLYSATAHVCKPNSKRGVKLGPRTPPAKALAEVPAKAPASKSVNINKYLVETFGGLVDYEEDEEDNEGNTIPGNSPDDMPDMITKALTKVRNVENIMIKKTQKALQSKDDSISDLNKKIADDEERFEKIISELQRDLSQMSSNYYLESMKYDKCQKENAQRFTECTQLRERLVLYEKPASIDDIIEHV